MFANPEVLGGKAKVMEWAHATDFKHLPESAGSKKRRMPPPPKRPRKR